MLDGQWVLLEGGSLVVDGGNESLVLSNHILLQNDIGVLITQQFRFHEIVLQAYGGTFVRSLGRFRVLVHDELLLVRLDVFIRRLLLQAQLGGCLAIAYLLKC